MTGIETEDLTIEEFCMRHGACQEGRDWALANCNSMPESWEKLPAEYLVWTATRPGVLPDKELRLFAVFCCMEIWHLITDPRSREAVEVAERFANGQATREELEAAYAAAYYAAYDPAYDAACRAAYYAAYAAAYDAACRAAYAAARDKQAAWLRANCKPNFRKKGKQNEYSENLAVEIGYRRT